MSFSGRNLRSVTASEAFLLVLASSEPIWLAVGTRSPILNAETILASPAIATGAAWRHHFVATIVRIRRRSFRIWIQHVPVKIGWGDYNEDKTQEAPIFARSAILSGYSCIMPCDRYMTADTSVADHGYICNGR